MLAIIIDSLSTGLLWFLERQPLPCGFCKLALLLVPVGALLQTCYRQHWKLLMFPAADVLS